MRLNVEMAKKIKSKLNDYIDNIANLSDKAVPVVEKVFLVASIRDGARTTSTRMHVSELTSTIIFDLLEGYINEYDNTIKTSNKRNKATHKKKNNSKKL